MIYNSIYGGELAESRDEAISHKVKRYKSESKCKNCGFNIRLVSTHQCTRCLKRRKPPSKSKKSRVKRNTSLNLGITHFDGQACVNCGSTKKLVSTRQCVKCLSNRKGGGRKSVNRDRVNAKRRSKLGRARAREFHKKMMSTSESYRITKRVRSDLRSCFKNNNSKLGYSRRDLLNRIESTMKCGMSWSNYGRDWEIDHIKPISIMIRDGVTDSLEINKLSNLRALWKSENVGLNGYA